MKTLLFCLMLVFATCGGQKTGVDSDTQKAVATPENKSEGQVNDSIVQNLDYGLTWLAGDSYSGTELAESLIIRDSKSLQKFYSRVNRTRKPGLPVPAIDFSKELIIVRCSGAIRSEALPEFYVLEDTADEIVLGIKDIDRKPTSSAVVTPFSVYRMDNTDKEVSVKN